MPHRQAGLADHRLSSAGAAEARARPAGGAANRPRPTLARRPAPARSQRGVDVTLQPLARLLRSLGMTSAGPARPLAPHETAGDGPVGVRSSGRPGRGADARHDARGPRAGVAGAADQAPRRGPLSGCTTMCPRGAGPVAIEGRTTHCGRPSPRTPGETSFRNSRLSPFRSGLSSGKCLTGSFGYGIKYTSATVAHELSSEKPKGLHRPFCCFVQGTCKRTAPVVGRPVYTEASGTGRDNDQQYTRRLRRPGTAFLVSPEPFPPLPMPAVGCGRPRAIQTPVSLRSLAALAATHCTELCGAGGAPALQVGRVHRRHRRQPRRVHHHAPLPALHVFPCVMPSRSAAFRRHHRPGIDDPGCRHLPAALLHPDRAVERPGQGVMHALVTPPIEDWYRTVDTARNNGVAPATRSRSSTDTAAR